MNELRGMMAEGPQGPGMAHRVRAFIDDLKRRYGPRVIGQRPCTKLYSHYTADFTRLPQWETIRDCAEHCTKYVINNHHIMNGSCMCVCLSVCHPPLAPSVLHGRDTRPRSLTPRALGT